MPQHKHTKNTFFKCSNYCEVYASENPINNKNTTESRKHNLSLLHKNECLCKKEQHKQQKLTTTVWCHCGSYPCEC